ncbi:hypothetical protein ACWDE9_18955 [Streptomyces olivaceoviridis]
MPLLFIEVDNCHETAEELADKLEKHVRFFLRKVKDTDGRERPMWRTRWPAPATWSGDATFPPVLLVFNRIGERNPDRTVPRLMELTRHLWQGDRQKGGHHHYDGRIPIIATGLNPLREHGPAGAVFLRFGRDHKQHLWEAIGNPRREAADARAREEARIRQEEYQAQVRRAAQEQAARKAAVREARRPICADCGAKFTDERWEAAQATDWGRPRDTHPHLCDDCKQKADTVKAPAADERGQQGPVRDGAAGLPAACPSSRLYRLRCRVHRRMVEGGRARRLERHPRAPAVSARGLRPAGRHRPTAGLAGRASAPGARPGRARAEDRRHLALPLPQVTRGPGCQWRLPS